MRPASSTTNAMTSFILHSCHQNCGGKGRSWGSARAATRDTQRNAYNHCDEKRKRRMSRPRPCVDGKTWHDTMQQPAMQRPHHTAPIQPQPGRPINQHRISWTCAGQLPPVACSKGRVRCRYRNTLSQSGAHHAPQLLALLLEQLRVAAQVLRLVLQQLDALAALDDLLNVLHHHRLHVVNLKAWYQARQGGSDADGQTERALECSASPWRD